MVKVRCWSQRNWRWSGVSCQARVDVDAQGIGSKDFPMPAATFIGFVLVKNHLGQNYESGFRVQ